MKGKENLSNTMMQVQKKNSKFTRENKHLNTLKEIRQVSSYSGLQEENDDYLFNISDDSDQEEEQVIQNL